MNYVYKKVKVAKPHCPVCGEMLLGEGSLIFPYECSCGEWIYDWGKEEFEIIKRIKVDRRHFEAK